MRTDQQPFSLFVFLPLQSTVTRAYIFTHQPDPALQAAAGDGVVPSSAVPQQSGAHANYYPSCPRSQENMSEDVR